MEGTIILFEGMDFTGKTTLAKHLNKSSFPHAQYQHVPTVSDLSHTIYMALRQCNPEESVKKAMMLALNIIAINELNALRASGETIIVDRSVLSFLVYQNIRMNEYQQLADLFGIPELKVDYVFFLYADADVIFSRYKSRHDKDALDDYFIEHMREIDRRYRSIGDLFFKPRIPPFWVDTGIQSVEEITTLVEKICSP